MVDARPSDAEKVAALREAIPATGAGIYLDTATRGPLPSETAAAMREADDWELRVGRVSAGRREDVEQRAEEARAVLAALVTAQPSEMALFPGVGPALALAAWAPDWQPGDRALTISHQGPELGAALLGPRLRLGVDVDVVSLADDADADAALAALADALTPRTRLLMLPHVSAATGLRLPLAAIADLARASDAWLVVDASQAAGAVPLVAADAGADVVAFAADTWPLAPEGTAALWAGPRVLAEARLPLAGPGTEGPADARRLEIADLPRTVLLGLARSVGWLEMYVGLDWALDRAGRLAAAARDALANIDGVEVLTPHGSMGTIVTFRLRGWSADELAEELGRRIFAITATVPARDAVRASICWFNTDEELERLIDAAALLAAHTPATLPSRPSLVVMPAIPPAEPEG